MKAFIRLSGFLVISGALHADWSDYKAVSLSQAWAQAGVGPDQSVDTYMGAPQQYKFLVKAVYTGLPHSSSYRTSLAASDTAKERMICSGKRIDAVRWHAGLSRRSGSQTVLTWFEQQGNSVVQGLDRRF